MEITKHPTVGLVLMLVLLFSGCVSTAPPKKPENVCAIFQEKPEWYWSAYDAQKAWHVPISVQMAVIYQESSYRANARPDRQWIFGIIPWFRPSSALGYAQILDTTWSEYVAKTGHVGSRKDFASATSFIGWYAEQARKRVQLQKSDAYRLYLAYHEGIGGYEKQSYSSKPWLISIAKKVKKRAGQYQNQLQKCEQDIPKRHWWSFW